MDSSSCLTGDSIGNSSPFPIQEHSARMTRQLLSRRQRKKGFQEGPSFSSIKKKADECFRSSEEYVYAWIDAVNSSGYRAGVYCSGIPAREKGGVTIITANDLQDNANGRKIVFLIYNDSCPPSPGCDFQKKSAFAATEWHSIRRDLAIRSVASKAGDHGQLPIPLRCRWQLLRAPFPANKGH